MKNLKTLIMALPLFFLTQILSGQGHYQATPENFVAIAQEIAHVYPTKIDIPISDIETHLMQIVHPDSYNEDCNHSSLEFAGMDENSISLSWNFIPGVAIYEVAYINLQTGESGQELLIDTQYTFNGLNDGLYAFSLVTFCGDSRSGGSSKSDIIIIHKPVLFKLGSEINCNCTAPDVVSSTTYSSGKYTVNWVPKLNEYYQFEIKYLNNVTSTMILKAISSGISSPALNFKIGCLQNMNYGATINDNAFHAPNGVNDIHISMSLPSYAFTIGGSGTWKISTITISKCKGKTPKSLSGSLTNSQQIIYPNPAYDLVTIKYSNKTKEMVHLQVFNALGVMNYSNYIRPNEKQQIAIAQWDPGLYQVVITDGAIKKSSTFIKVD